MEKHEKGESKAQEKKEHLAKKMKGMKEHYPARYPVKPLPEHKSSRRNLEKQY